MSKQADTLTLAKKTKYISIYAITQPKRMSFLGTSFEDMQAILTKLYGNFPIRLSAENIPQIEAAGVITGANGDCWRELEAALKQYGNVELAIED